MLLQRCYKGVTRGLTSSSRAAVEYTMSDAERRMLGPCCLEKDPYITECYKGVTGLLCANEG
jgi:hypothetical protein